MVRFQSRTIFSWMTFYFASTAAEKAAPWNAFQMLPNLIGTRIMFSLIHKFILWNETNHWFLGSWYTDGSKKVFVRAARMKQAKHKMVGSTHGDVKNSKQRNKLGISQIFRSGGWKIWERCHFPGLWIATFPLSGSLAQSRSKPPSTTCIFKGTAFGPIRNGGGKVS